MTGIFTSQVLYYATSYSQVKSNQITMKIGLKSAKI